MGFRKPNTRRITEEAPLFQKVAFGGLQVTRDIGGGVWGRSVPSDSRLLSPFRFVEFRV